MQTKLDNYFSLAAIELDCNVRLMIQKYGTGRKHGRRIKTKNS